MADDDCKKPICKDNPYAHLRGQLFHDEPNDECPLDRNQLGAYSWALIHTFTAYYPQSPTPNDRTAMQGFLNGFKYLYPCTHCRGHFQKDYDRGMWPFILDPPNLEDHKEINLWACRQHNYVNKILGKAQFNCDY